MFGGGNYLITSVRLIQISNNRNDHFRYFLGMFLGSRPRNRGVRLIKVSFKVNKGNKFGDFGYCPLNIGCSLSTPSHSSSALALFSNWPLPLPY